MSIEVMVINDDAIVIKGLRTANESRSIAIDCKQRRDAEAMDRLAEKDFVSETINEMSKAIDWASHSGRCEATATGYGHRCSPLRSYSLDDIEMMKQVLAKQIFPIFKSKGYSCSVKACQFASRELYLEVKINW